MLVETSNALRANGVVSGRTSTSAAKRHSASRQAGCYWKRTMRRMREFAFPGLFEASCAPDLPSQGLLICSQNSTDRGYAHPWLEERMRQNTRRQHGC